MQTPKESEITKEILESKEYQIIEATIKELNKSLILIQEGITIEIEQIQTLNKILDSQLKILKEFRNDTVVPLNTIKGLKLEYEICLDTIQQKVEAVKSLNEYLSDRIKQLNILQRKRQEIIKKYKAAQVIEIKKKNEKK